MEFFYFLLIVLVYVVVRIFQAEKTLRNLRNLNDTVTDLNLKMVYLERKIERILSVGRTVPVDSAAEKASETKPEAAPQPIPEPEIVNVPASEPSDMPLRPVPELEAKRPSSVPPPVEEIFTGAQPEPERVVETIDSGSEDRMERFIGVNLFSKIGIAVLVLGIGFFVKYAIDNDWIGEIARTVLGMVAGGVLWGISYFLRSKYKSFSAVVAGGGFAVCFVTIAVAYNFYGLFSPGLAFAILLLLTVMQIVVALWYDRRELASVGLVAAFAAPFLSAGPDGSPATLSGYVAILSAGVLVVSWKRPAWFELPLAGCLLSWIVALIVAFSLPAEGPVWVVFIATVFIFIIYSLPLTRILGLNPGQWHSAAVVSAMFINNVTFIIVGLKLMGHMLLPPVLDGLVPVLAAAVNGIVFFRYFMRAADSLPKDIVILLTVVSSCLFFPVEFGAHSITVVAIAFYAFALNRLYCRNGRMVFKVLLILALCALFIDLVLLGDDGFHTPTPVGEFFAYFLSGAAIIGAAATLAFHPRAYSAHHTTVYTIFLWSGILSAVYGIYCVAGADSLCAARAAVAAYMAAAFVLSLATRRGGNAGWLFPTVSALAIVFGCRPDTEAGAVPDVLLWVAFALYCATMYFQGRRCFRTAWFGPLSRWLFIVLFTASAAVVAIAATFNILMLCNLAKLNSAAVSVLLSVCGAVTVWIGMRKHDKALRITGLAFFGVVLVKLVAYDLWTLSSVGRIIVFIILGILLLGISFLYNKLRKALFD